MTTTPGAAEPASNPTAQGADEDPTGVFGAATPDPDWIFENGEWHLHIF
jgi:hypothetical protein